MPYSTIGFIAIGIHMIVNKEILYKRNSDLRYEERHYRFFLMSVIAFYLIDVIWGIVYDYHKKDIFLLSDFKKHNKDNMRKKKVVISFGFSEFTPESGETCSEVFQRADDKMYDCKRMLKAHCETV